MIRNPKTCFIPLILISVIICFSAVFCSKAEPRQESAPKGYYESIKIHYGDTLETIAENYNNSDFYNKQEYMDLIRQVNGLYSDDIHAGNYLAVVTF